MIARQREQEYVARPVRGGESFVTSGNFLFDWLNIRYDRPKPSVNERWRFSLIHPSRGRVSQGLAAIRTWLTRCSSWNDIEYILSLDTEDCRAYAPVILGMMREPMFKVVIGPNENVVQAVNRGARSATGHVYIMVSDDFEPPFGWDVEIQKAVMYEKTPWALFVNDGLQKEMKVQTITIVSNAYYGEVGYMYYPEYWSMYADNDYTETAKALKAVIYAYHLTFMHNHPQSGRAEMDDTYRREERPEAWKIGERVFAERKAKNFGVTL